MPNSSLKTSGKHISRNLNRNLCALPVSAAYMSLAVPGEISDGQEKPVMLPPAVAVGRETLSVHRVNNCRVRLAGSWTLRKHELWFRHRLGTVKHLFGNCLGFCGF